MKDTIPPTLGVQAMLVGDGFGFEPALAAGEVPYLWMLSELRVPDAIPEYHAETGNPRLSGHTFHARWVVDDRSFARQESCRRRTFSQCGRGKF